MKIFGSRWTEKSATEGVSSTSSDKTIRCATQIIENILDYDPCHEEDSPFIQAFQELFSISRIDFLITLSHDNIRILDSSLSRKKNNGSSCSITSNKKLQLFFKYLQEKGIYEIGTSFDYSSIDEDDFHDFV